MAIGAAWYDREHAGLGAPFPRRWPDRQGFERLEEALQICLRMWSEDDGPFRGMHYQLAETLCRPRSLSRPHPPIVIGGGGERKTLRLVAATPTGPICSVPRQTTLPTSSTCCADTATMLGATTTTSPRSVLYLGGWPLPDGFVEAMSEYAALGADTVVVMARGDEAPCEIEALGAEVIPQLAAL